MEKGNGKRGEWRRELQDQPELNRFGFLTIDDDAESLDAGIINTGGDGAECVCDGGRPGLVCG